MACNNHGNNANMLLIDDILPIHYENAENQPEEFLFGVDSDKSVLTLLQNNLTAYEWVCRNKDNPNYWGRNLTGSEPLTKEETQFLFNKGCQVVPYYDGTEEIQTQEQGVEMADKITFLALSLGIPDKTAIYLKVDDENVTTEFLEGFAKQMLENGFRPGFMANTDSAFCFDREFSRGLLANPSVFERCVIWATSPNMPEYERINTTHLIHPDEWKPFAPSGITKAQIAIWQYGEYCHPINDINDDEFSFNANLVMNEKIVTELMF